MKTKFLVAGLAALTILPSAAIAKKKPELSGLALQQMQARDYEVPKSVSFPAVMTVLQDSGYRISSADKDTGLIVASASTKSNTTWVPFVGFGKSKKTPVVSAFIEDRGKGSRVRLSFVLTKDRSGMYGQHSSDEEPINDVTVYQGAFERLEKEIFLRASLDTTTAPAVPRPEAAVAPSSAPAAPTTETTN